MITKRTINISNIHKDSIYSSVAEVVDEIFDILQRSHQECDVILQQYMGNTYHHNNIIPQWKPLALYDDNYGFKHHKARFSLDDDGRTIFHELITDRLISYISRGIGPQSLIESTKIINNELQANIHLISQTPVDPKLSDLFETEAGLVDNIFVFCFKGF